MRLQRSTWQKVVYIFKFPYSSPFACTHGHSPGFNGLSFLTMDRRTFLSTVGKARAIIVLPSRYV